MSGTTYYIGLEYGTGKVKCWGNNHRRSTVVVHMRRDKDYLPPDLNVYLGDCVTTRERGEQRKAQLLDWINRTYGKNFTHIIID